MYGEILFSTEVIWLKCEIYCDPDIRSFCTRQRSYGSWGEGKNLQSQIISSKWAFKSLLDMGFSLENAAMKKTKDFLVKNAILEGRVSINGKREGVLCCYTGILGFAFIEAGFLEEAAPVIWWIINHQEYKFAGKDFLNIPTLVWGGISKNKIWRVPKPYDLHGRNCKDRNFTIYI